MRVPITGLVGALVALAPLVWRPDLPLLYVTVIWAWSAPPSAWSNPVTAVPVVAAKASVTVVLSQALPMLAPT